MSKITLINPRELLRHGSKNMFAAAANGDTVIVRAGSIVREGRHLVRSEHGNSTSAYGQEVASKVYKLVELNDIEVAQLQRDLDIQEGYSPQN